MTVVNKSYKLPFVTDKSQIRVPVYVTVFQSEDKPDYTADGYGRGTNHTYAEILDYLRSFGIDVSKLRPDICRAEMQNIKNYNLLCPDYSVIGSYDWRDCNYVFVNGDAIYPEGWEQEGGQGNYKYTAGNFQGGAGQYGYGQVTYNPRSIIGSNTYFRWGTEQPEDSFKGTYINAGSRGQNDQVAYLNLIWLADDFTPTAGCRGKWRSYAICKTTNTVGEDAYYIDINVVIPSVAAYFGKVYDGTIDDFEWDGAADDPYSPEGYSEQQGGTGTASWEGDEIGIPPLPTLSAVDTGFISLYNPTPAQVQALASYMWSSGFDIDTFRKIVADPMDCILGMAIFPLDPLSGTAKIIKVGNLSTPVTMPPVLSQWQEKDCGTLDVQEFWGSYLDYSPYTKISLYLPYIGIVPLDTDDVMNGPIRVVYHVDMLSGACVAYVLCHGTQLYTYNGQCSCNIPITSNDFTNTVNGVLGIAGNVGSLIASGGKSAASDLTGVVSNAVNAFKPNIQKSGALSGTGGLMGVQTPYLIMQRPKQSLARTHAATKGYPANISVVLGDITGYAEIDAIHLEGVPCTQAEAEEIEQLLKSGVYL